MHRTDTITLSAPQFPSSQASEPTDMLTAERPRRGTNSKSKLAEIDKPRGFERNLPLAAIVGATTDAKQGHQLMFLVQWLGCVELDLLPASEVYRLCPETAIAYYEARSPLVQKCARRKRICEKAADDLVAFPPTEAPTPPPKLTLEAIVAEVVDEEPTAAAPVDGDADVTTESAAATGDETPATDVNASTTGEEDASMQSAEQTEEDGSVVREASGGVDTPTMDEDPNDTFLSEVASEAAEHQARTEALPEDIEMPNVPY